MKYVPELRFPEFKGEWEEKRLEQVLNIFNGYAFSSKDATQSGVPWVKIANVGILNMKKEDLSFLPLSFEEKYSRFLLYKDDIVLALTRPILNGQLKIAVIDQYFDGSLLNQRVGKLLTEENKNFIYYYLQKGNVVNAIDNRIAGTDPPNLAPSEINSLKIRVCSYLEQEKIASFLTTIDNKINLLKEKEEALEQYKKGIMQQLFSQELRFKDDQGNDFPDWEEKRLGDIGETFNGLSGKTKKDFDKGEAKYIQYKQIFDNSKIDITGFGKVEVLANENQNRVRYGDVLFTVSSETPHEVGMSSVLLDEVDNLYLNSFSFGVRLKSLEKTIPYYLRQYFRSELFRRKTYKLAQGSTRFNLSKIAFMKLKIELPSPAEQEKIASFLGSIDDKIALVQQELAHLEDWKRGLLQQMFV